MNESRHDWLNDACKAKLKNPDPTWHWCKWEVVNGGTIVTGSATTKKKDGSYKWLPIKQCDVIIVTMADIKTEKEKYISDTGNCATCCGTGQEWRGWNYETGHKYEPCRDCGATGKANA